MKGIKRLDFLVPAIVAALFIVLGAVGALDPLEQKIYDTLLHVKPALPENPSILFMDVDDTAIKEVGSWPWSRDVMADGLILMREMGAAYAMFDIEYLNQSPPGLDTFTLKNKVPDAFNQELARMQTNVDDLLSAISAGQIPARDAAAYSRSIQELAAKGMEDLLGTVSGVERDNDAYLGRAARFFGSLYLTVGAPQESGLDGAPESVAWARDSVALKNVTVERDPLRKAGSLDPAILPILKGAAGAGFPNVVVDADGVRRRIDLIKNYNGSYFAQLAFRPLLAYLGNPSITLKRHSIVLKDAVIPGREKRDITIPLTADGTFLINWTPRTFVNSFRHLSFYSLIYYGKMEADLLYNLGLMSQNKYLQYGAADQNPLDILAYADSLKTEILASGDLSLMDEYIKARAAFFESAGSFLSGPAEGAILADLDKALAVKGLTQAQRADLEERKAIVGELFDSTRPIYQNLSTTRAVLQKNLPGAFVIVGVTATSTTDIGVNPFDNQYVNVGTHASVVNTILQGKFLMQAPWWYGAILALVLAFGVTLLIIRFDALKMVLLGAAVIVVLIAALAVYFILTGTYAPMVSPVGAVFFTFAALTALSFFRAERSRNQVRSTFSHYLSTDVISQLLADPGKLKLGGDKKHLTAMFTDVKGFSTISEALGDPEALVHLLNRYLTEMSDIILDLRGTLDKFEGDAIISFFGAPVELQDHARRACLAAVRMKRAEIILNEKFLSEKLSPTTLLTRIGINTGDMVVGNMGTEKRMDYTIMGNSVNLAARLEGVNKQYGTWILMSEFTQAQCRDHFFTRRLDRVRVVGITQPVRLYELIEENGAQDKKATEGIFIFHEGLELFESRQWGRAEEKFKEVLRLLPNDEPAKTYAKRCQDYKVKPPAEGWDGVFNLSVK